MDPRSDSDDELNIESTHAEPTSEKDPETNHKLVRKQGPREQIEDKKNDGQSESSSQRREGDEKSNR